MSDEFKPPYGDVKLEQRLNAQGKIETVVKQEIVGVEIPEVVFANEVDGQVYAKQCRRCALWHNDTARRHYDEDAARGAGLKALRAHIAREKRFTDGLLAALRRTLEGRAEADRLTRAYAIEFGDVTNDEGNNPKTS